MWFYLKTRPQNVCRLRMRRPQNNFWTIFYFFFSRRKNVVSHSFIKTERFTLVHFFVSCFSILKPSMPGTPCPSSWDQYPLVLFNYTKKKNLQKKKQIKELKFYLNGVTSWVQRGFVKRSNHHSKNTVWENTPL